MSLVSRQKAVAEFEADRDRLEVLMQRRNEQKLALEGVTNQQGAFVKTMGGSFFFMAKPKVEKVVRIGMEQDEAELKEICARVEKATAGRRQEG